MNNAPSTKSDHDALLEPAQTTEEPNEDSRSWPQPGTIAGSHEDRRSWSYPRSFEVSVAVDPIALITTECIAVTSAMRKHARWAHSSVTAILGGGMSSTYGLALGQRSHPREKPIASEEQGNQESLINKLRVGGEASLANRWGLRGKKGKSMQDNPLISAFAKLRVDIGRCKGMVQLTF